MNGPVGAPKEGAYRDAALRVIGEQIDERIDEVNRHRRRRARVGVTLLALVAVGSGSIAAYAVVNGDATSNHASVASVATTTAQTSCTNAESGTYFTARYRADRASRINQARLCTLVHDRLIANPSEYRALSPDQAISAAASFLTAAGGSHVFVDGATFGDASTRADK